MCMQVEFLVWGKGSSTCQKCLQIYEHVKTWSVHE